MKNKKGSHVGTVLSFTIFILFLIFAYVIIGPVGKFNDQKENSLYFLGEAVLSNVSDQVIVSYLYGGNNTGGCIEINTPAGFTNAISLNSSEEEISSIIEGSKTSVQGGYNLTKVFFSKGYFDNSSVLTPGTCVALPLKSQLNETRILEKKIINLINLIESDYSSVKDSLGFSDYEINIRFEYSNGTVIGLEKEDVKASRYAEEKILNYLDTKAREKTGKLILEIW
jgi:hypothetical protein